MSKLSQLLCIFSVLIVGFLHNAVSSAGFEALSKLPYLRKFLFSLYEESEYDDKSQYMLMCAKFLPKLKMVKEDFAEYLCYSTLASFGRQSDSSHGSILQEPRPVALGLEQAALVGVVQPHESCQLPDLKTLFWFEPIGDAPVSFCTRFQTVTELFLVLAVDEDLVMGVLQEVGQRLTKLELGVVRQALPLAKIFQCCPNVECLRIEYCTFNAWAKWPSTIKDFCTHLKEFTLNMNCEPLPRDFIINVRILCLYSTLLWKKIKCKFFQLFNVPNLKKVHLEETYLSKYEVDDLLGLISQRRVLSNIVKLKWWNFFRGEEKLKEWMADKAHFHLLLDNIQVACPHLSTIEPVRREASFLILLY